MRKEILLPAIAVVGGGVTVGDKAVIPPHAMIREDVKGGEQA